MWNSFSKNDMNGFLVCDYSLFIVGVKVFCDQKNIKNKNISYSCTAVTTCLIFRSFLSSFTVSPKFETIMEDVDVHVGETSRLAVVVEGKPDPDILWYKV